MNNNYKYIKTKVLGEEISTIIDGGFFMPMITTTRVHEHSFFEAQICLNGEFFIETEKKTKVNISSGDILLIPSGCYHSTISSSENSHRAVVKFMLKRENKTEFFSPLANLRHPIIINGGETLGDIISMVIEELKISSLGTEEMIKALLDMFYIALIRKINPSLQEAEDAEQEQNDLDSYGERGYKMEQFFNKNHMKEITAEDLGRGLGLSIRQVNRMLQQTYKMSFREKLIDVRLHAAEGMLFSTELPVDEIGLEVGYRSPSGFGVAFKKKYGMTPSNYRKNYKI